jgi:drug/metabolite transporter (DMT)-like permease
MTLRVALAWLLATVLWSSTFLFIRVGLRDIPPFTFAWVRLAIAAVILGAVASLSVGWRGIGRRALIDIAAAGLLLLGVNYALVFWGAQFVPSGLVAILLAGTPVIALAFGWLLGSEQVTVRKTIALVTGIVGVIVIFGAEARASNAAALAGAAAVFAGSVCVALAYVWIKTRGHHVPPSAVATVQSLAGLMLLATLAFVFEGPPAPVAWTTASWLALLYLAVVASVVAFWLNYWLLQRMDTSAMLLMGVAEVPIAVALGAIVFGERLPPGTAVGAICVLISVLGALTGNRATSRTAAP